MNDLTLALKQQDWLAANLATRRLINELPLAENAELLRAIDTAWATASNNRFGFSTQRAVWESLGGSPEVKTFARWNLFKKFGAQVGWKESDPGWWLQTTESPGFPHLTASSNPKDSPIGLFPFHDVLASFHDDGFSPRDCWGEAVWDAWATLFEVL